MGAAPRRRRCTSAFRFLIVCPECGASQHGWFDVRRDHATLELSHDASFVATAEAPEGDEVVREVHGQDDPQGPSQEEAPTPQVTLPFTALSKE